MIICRQIIWFLLLTHQAVGQDTIRLINHSFEMTGAPEATLAGWKTLGVEPNIQPGENGCTLPARDGKNYIGLTVVGEISTGIAQELKVVLQKDSTYVLSLFLAHSKRYEGAQLTKTGFKAVNYEKPAILGLIGLNRQEGLVELMAVTAPVTDNKWQKHLVYFRPSKAGYNEIGFVALTKESKEQWNGHVLLDKISAIVQIPQAAADTLGALTGISFDIAPSDPNRITLQNASFDLGFYGMPMGWGVYLIENERLVSTGGYVESAKGPDKLPVNYGVDILKFKPSEGGDFASLTTSEKGLRTGFSQTFIDGSLEAGAEYEIRIDLAFAKKYRAVMPDGYSGKNYKNPLRLRIWGGTAANMRQELLAETSAVAHHKWKRYTFTLAPREGSYSSIFLEGAYVSDTGKPYDGHILLDNCSAIVKTTK